MNSILYQKRCKCKEEFVITKKPNTATLNQGKFLCYPEFDLEVVKSKTFNIKYEKELSLEAKSVLNSLSKKYFYYAIDDILYSFKSNKNERDSLLSILYSAAICLHNNLSINFFDIWVQEIYINQREKKNKFLIDPTNHVESYSNITIKFFYRPKSSIKEKTILW